MAAFYTIAFKLPDEKNLYITGINGMNKTIETGKGLIYAISLASPDAAKLLYEKCKDFEETKKLVEKYGQPIFVKVTR